MGVPETAWPPADFYLEVEAVRSGTDVAPRWQRLQAWADGTVLFRVADEALADPDNGLVTPVYATACAYVLHPDAIRLLARKAARRCGLQSDARPLLPAQIGDPPAVTAERLREWDQVRFLCRAQMKERVGSITEQTFASIAGVLQVVNQYVPPGGEFALAGMTLDPGDNVLLDVPQPRHDAAGALDCHRQLLERFPGDLDLVRDAFALACRLGDGAAARELLGRYRRLHAAAEALRPIVAEVPVVDPLHPDALERWLPGGAPAR